MPRHLCFALLIAASATACGGAQRARDEPAAELRVIAVPDSAIVEVNERFAGAARVLDKHPLRLKPGKKRVTIAAPGYFPHDLELDLPVGVTKLAIKLRPVPP
jgi:hypothetical protein